MRRALIALLLLATAACRPGSDADPVDRTVTLTTVDGKREAIVHHPASVTRPAALVVVLHGGFGSAAQAQKAYGWDTLADSKGFLVAYPDGHGRSWNGGPSCCGPANSQGYHDADFLHELVAQLSKTDDVDLSRVYAVGMSNGAMMSYGWACAHPGDLAGIGPVSGSRIADACTLPEPMNVVAVHGTADANVPIDGGIGSVGTTGVAYRSLTESLQPFLAGCSATPMISGSGAVHQRTWSCPGGHNVLTVVIDDAGHQWPGSTPPGKLGEVLGRDVPFAGFDATAFLWSTLDGRS